jgi:FAD dependent oxidoreductase
MPEFDVVIVGASFGGVSAALAAASDPKVRVVLLEPTNWVGGQATAQGVTRWDEQGIALVETCGSNKSYRDLRNAIRQWYRNNASLSAYGSEQQLFNPGFAQTGYPFTCDPSVANDILLGLLRALAPRLDLRLGATVSAVSVAEGAVTGVIAQWNGQTDTYTGAVYIDATDVGDLLPLAGLTWKIGAESHADTSEPSAPVVAHPDWIQPITVPVALERRPDGENHQIAMPAGYATIAKSQNFKVIDGDITGVFAIEPGGSETLWGYRRFIDARNFSDADYANDRSTINMGSNDYQEATIPTGDPAKDAQIVQAARAASLAYVYWLQTFVTRDGEPTGSTPTGYPNLMIRTDAFGTADGTAPAPYIRESRRIDSLTRIVQQDIDEDCYPAGSVRARNFPDSCGIGWYGIDVHPASGPGTQQVNFGTLRFQIPLGALLPKTLSNFVAGCKNIGATHLTSGAYRVHPVEWAVGEAAGVLAAFCVTQNVSPHSVWNQADRRASYQYRLLARGVPITWWSDVLFEDSAQGFAAIHLATVHGIFQGVGGLSFDPSGSVSDADRQALDQRVGRALPWPQTAMNRAETAIWICQQLGLPT